MNELERVRWEDAAALMREAAETIEIQASHDEHRERAGVREFSCCVCDVCLGESYERGRIVHQDECLVPRLRDYAAGIESGLRTDPALGFPSTVASSPEPPEARVGTFEQLVTIRREALGDAVTAESFFTIEREADGRRQRYLSVPVVRLTDEFVTVDLQKAACVLVVGDGSDAGIGDAPA